MVAEAEGNASPNPKHAGSQAPEAAALPPVFVETYGCQMNALDTELVLGQLRTLGYPMAATPQQAGVVLLNTCSVRDLSEQKVWSYLGRLARAKQAQPALIVGVLGCMAEREGAAFFRRMPHVDLVCGPANLDRLPELLHSVRLGQRLQLSVAGHAARRSSTLDQAQDGVESLDLSRASSPVPSGHAAYVRITRGCNKFCSFCVVPYVRGPERHRAPQAIVEEVRRLVDGGIQEITLIGQTINHYLHRDGGRSTSFADLLVQVHEQVPAMPRLRFLTSYPRDFSDAALQAMACSPRICRYLHVPAQSGANGLLKKMNRGYTVEQYLDLLARARALMPDICISGDMIAGFCGETEADHAASLALLNKAQLKSCYIFKYSPRPHTVAARRLADDVPEADKKARHMALLQLQGSLSEAHHRRQVGSVKEVLVEGASPLKDDGPAAHGAAVRLGWQRRSTLPRLVGRTPGDEMVALHGPLSWVGRRLPVRIEAAHASLLQGSCVTEP